MTLAPLADLDDLLVRAGVTDRERAMFALRRASALFRSAVRHPVSRVVDDELTAYGNGAQHLLLPAYPIETVTSVTVGATVLDPSTYVCRKDIGVLWRTVGLCWPLDAEVVIVYTHGVDPTPEEVQAVVLSAAQYGYRVGPENLTSTTLGAQSMTFDSSGGGWAGPSWSDVVAEYSLRGDRA